MRLDQIRVAIVHYWFVSRRGGEAVVEALAYMFPQADIFTLLADPQRIPDALRNHRIHTSFVQRIPGSLRLHRHLLPIYPFALEQFDLTGYDLVLSSDSGPAKGVLTSASTYHICYCHSPMRYLWDQFHEYRKNEALGMLGRLAFDLTAHYMRLWDLAAASRVDSFVANSKNVAQRIRKHYRRPATVIYPPVRVHQGFLSSNHGDHYLMVGQLVRYKHFHLGIQACNQLGRPLRIVGEGEGYKELRRIAGPTVQFLGALPDAELRQQYACCRALLFPGEEDFGMVPVEAQSFGRPVIAFGRGGATESVRGAFVDEMGSPEEKTGVFFREKTAASLGEAIRWFESCEARFSPAHIRRHVERFGVERFQKEMASLIRCELDARGAAFPGQAPVCP